MKKWHQTTKDKNLIIVAKIHVIIMTLTLCGGIVGIYFIFGNLLYTFIFNVLSEKKIIVTKITSGFHNKVYYFASTITSLIIVLIIISFLQ